jgi:hypothetical protein
MSYIQSKYTPSEILETTIPHHYSLLIQSYKVDPAGSPLLKEEKNQVDLQTLIYSLNLQKP